MIPIPSQDPDCSRPDQAVNNLSELNEDVQKKLYELRSPFQYYELVGTQWPRWTASPPVADTVFDVLPELLANTTMETFSQNTSSCMGCHSMARTLNPSTTVSADFSFTLNNAKPKPVGALCDTVEGSWSCSDSILPPPPRRRPEGTKLEEWQDILYGYEVTTRTYELTRPRYIRSKLHCSSCHLNAGGNSNAAWWVGLEAKDRYDYPATTRLQDRINGCFERSMNGEAICSTADGPEDCKKIRRCVV